MYDYTIERAVTKAFNKHFNYSSTAYGVIVNGLDGHNKARVEIRVPILICSLDAICDFRNAVEEALRCKCTLNVSTRKNKLLFILALEK